MRTLVFDTETTGKADFKADVRAPHQPHLVQLAVLLYNNRELVSAVNLICQPTHGELVIQIPEEASKIHGISNELATLVGLPYKLLLPFFNNLLKRTDRMVAHNMAFDARVIAAAYHRNGYPVEQLSVPQRVCTMRSSEDVLKLPSPYYKGKFKYPSLDEAYRKLVDPNGFDGAHDALVDAKACAAVLWALEDAGHILKS